MAYKLKTHWSLYLVIACVIVILGYSIYWTTILINDPNISYIDMKLYPIKHWKEFIPMWISFLILVLLYFTIER